MTDATTRTVKGTLCPALALLAAIAFGSAGPAAAATTALEPVRDNSIFSDSGSLSNGAGANLYSGLTGFLGPRRALLDFDVAGSIPAGSTIDSASLRLVVVQSGTGSSATDVFSVHRLGADWGEGTSNAGGVGTGAAAVTPDATWDFSMFSTVSWTSAGGDFALTPSASTAMPTVGLVSFSSSQLSADVAEMLANPSADHGWILIGDETILRSARKFHSRESTTASFRPQLIVEFTPPPLQSVTLEPVKDNSIYELPVTSSNGAGPELFSGRTDFFVQNGLRRALLAFDVAGAIPAGSTIATVSLSLNVLGSGPSSSPTQISSLHRVTADWGEGNSGAGTSSNGAGSQAQDGADATWTDRFYNVSSWLAAGGDFVAGASASFQTPIGGAVTIPTNGSLAADVADWLANPAGNFGWILRGDEAGGANQTARRWDSRESATAANRPRLTIQYIPGSGGGTRGSVPDGDDLPGVPLRLSKLGGDDVRLIWSASCKGDDTDYAVYEGTIGSWYDHGALACTTGGALNQAATIAATRAYLLVVPNDGTDEGSYGDDSGDTERPVATSGCGLTQDIGAPVCP